MLSFCTKNMPKHKFGINYEQVQSLIYSISIIFCPECLFHLIN